MVKKPMSGLRSKRETGETCVAIAKKDTESIRMLYLCPSKSATMRNGKRRRTAE